MEPMSFKSGMEERGSDGRYDGMMVVTDDGDRV